MADDIVRVKSDDPTKCEELNCPIQKVILSEDPLLYGTKCKAHGGYHQQRAHKRESLFKFNLGRWTARVQEHAKSPTIKSLRNEVGVLRLLLEERFKSIKDSTDLLVANGPISELVLKIDKLVNSCERLETRQGLLMDKTELISHAEAILEIIMRNTALLNVDPEDEEAFFTSVSDQIAALLSPEGAEQC